MKTTPMKALHTGAATTTSLLSEVATPLYGFISAAATLKTQPGGEDGKIIKSTFSTCLGWSNGFGSDLIIYIRCKATI